MASRTQKLEALKSFLEVSAFSRIDGHDANDGFGCKGHDEAFTAKAEELLSLIEDENYGYESTLVEAYHKVYAYGKWTHHKHSGNWRVKKDEELFLKLLSENEDAAEAFNAVNSGECFTLLVYKDGTTSFEVNRDDDCLMRQGELISEINESAERN